MNPTANRIFTLVTMAGIAGLLVLNWRGTNTLLQTTAQATTGYLKTVQGR